MLDLYIGPLPPLLFLLHQDLYTGPIPPLMDYPFFQMLGQKFQISSKETAFI